MKKLALLVAIGLFFVACNNDGSSSTTTDSTTIKNNTNTSNESTIRSDSLGIDTMNKKDTTKKY